MLILLQFLCWNLQKHIFANLQISVIIAITVTLPVHRKMVYWIA